MLNAAVPLQGIVSEERLAVTNVDGRRLVRVAIVAEEIDALGRGFHEEGTACPGYILRQAQGEVGGEQILFHKLHTAVAHCHLVDGAIQVGVGRQRQVGQVVGSVVAIVPVGGTEAVAGTLCIGRLFLRMVDSLLQGQFQGLLGVEDCPHAASGRYQ